MEQQRRAWLDLGGRVWSWDFLAPAGHHKGPLFVFFFWGGVVGFKDEVSTRVFWRSPVLFPEEDELKVKVHGSTCSSFVEEKRHFQFLRFMGHNQACFFFFFCWASAGVS